MPKRLPLTPLLVVLSIASILLGVYIGPVFLPPSKVNWAIFQGLRSLFSGGTGGSGTFIIVWEIRLPRVLAAYLTGSLLASAGVAAQALFKNPMADPYLLGISGGAAVGASLAFLLFPSHVGSVAFLFSLVSVYVVYRVAKVGDRIPVENLLLAGIAYGFMAGAITSYVIVVLGPKAHLTWMWLMGSLNGATWSDGLRLLVVTIFGVLFLQLNWKNLNLLLLGEESVALGLDVDLFRKLIIVAIAVMTSATVPVAGIIGFVGLMAPHIVRFLVGPNHRRLVLNAALFGGILLVLADTLARTVARPLDIPVGIITSMMGGPFFLYLLRKRKRRGLL